MTEDISSGKKATAPFLEDGSLDVSLIIPAYNAADTLRRAVEVSIEQLSTITQSYEVLIAEDGSEDCTAQLAEELSQLHECVVHLHSDERLGRGTALTRAIRAARGDVVMYMDVDLATDPSHIPQLVKSVQKGCDVATGSRLIEKSRADRPAGRLVPSVVFNTMVRWLLASGVHDHQCGFKAFKRESIHQILGEVRDTHWFWDTEVLVRAQQKGMSVCEHPVRWEQGEHTKVKLTHDVPYMGISILRLLWQTRLSGRFGLKQRLALSAVLLALIFFVMLMSVDAQAVVHTLFSAAIPVLVLASVLYASSYLVRGARYCGVLSSVGVRLDLLFLSEVVYISQLANLVLPMRLGDISRIYVLKKTKNVSLPDGFSSVAIERIYDVLAIGFVGVLALLAVSTAHQWMVYLTGAAIGMCAVLVLTLYLLTHSSTLSETLTQRLLPSRKLRESALKVLADVSRSSTSPKTFVMLTLLSLAIWAFDIATCVLVLDALGMSAGIGLVALAVAIANIVKVVPFTPGGIGQYEAALAAVLVLGGFSPVLCVSCAILDHLIKNAVTLVVGGVVFLRYNLRWSELTSMESAA
ncbi:MAG: flippase-like domain-containing protein [Methermicoccaceae archaeon]